MNEYINKHDVLVALMDNDLDHIQAPNGKEAVQIFSELPPADVAPVVRCRDCKRWNDGNVILGCYWDVDGGQPEEMDFCSRGERREE